MTEATWRQQQQQQSQNGASQVVLVVKNPPANAGDRTDSGSVLGVAKSWTRLSDFPFTFHFPALEKEMATHSSVLAWKIPGTAEPRGLPAVGSHRVRHD